MDKAHGVTAQRITARNRLTLPRRHMGSRRLGGCRGYQPVHHRAFDLGTVHDDSDHASDGKRGQQ